MKQRGKRSAASFDIVQVNGKPPRLEPPRSLSKAERKIFLDLVNAADADHFRPYDAILLCRYCEAVVLAERAAKHLRKIAVFDGKASAWIVVQEKAVRAMIALSMRLRLSPQ